MPGFTQSLVVGLTILLSIPQSATPHFTFYDVVLIHHITSGPDLPRESVVLQVYVWLKLMVDMAWP